jgi:uncharacterized protein YdaU (DUF1376 family)
VAKNPDNWFKFYPDPWIDDTRHLSENGRFVYFESIVWMRKLDGPLPDDVRWLVCALHSDRKKVKRGLDELFADGKLIRTPDGLINPKCMADIAARKHQREVNTKTARTRTENRRSADTAQVVRGSCAVSAASETSLSNDQSINDISKAPGFSLNEVGSTCARTESEKEDSKKDSPPAPQRGNGGVAFDDDDPARKAYLDGMKNKGGKVAKSARAVQASTGELDGRRGILFVDGKLTVTGQPREELQSEYPDVDIDAVCVRAAVDLLQWRGGFPRYADAMALLRKSADILKSVRYGKSQASKKATRSLTPDEQRKHTARILASDEPVWDPRDGAGPHQPGCLFTERDCFVPLKAAFDESNNRVRTADRRRLPSQQGVLLPFPGGQPAQRQAAGVAG